jgi:hypothetical protein
MPQTPHCLDDLEGLLHTPRIVSCGQGIAYALTAFGLDYRMRPSACVLRRPWVLVVLVLATVCVCVWCSV